MKKLLAIVLIMPLFSCSIDSEIPISLHMTGDWILVQTSGQVPNSTQTGSDMPFQETYSLKSDGTFEKIRLENGEILKVSGRFELSETSREMENEDVKFYVYFHHETRSSLLATCYYPSPSTYTEYLYLNTSGRLISTYNACDGLGMEYEKKIK